MQHIDIADAKTKVEMLFQSALEGEEIIITWNNRPVLRLSQLSKQPKHRRRGSARGKIWMSPDFDEPLDDFAEYMA